MTDVNMDDKDNVALDVDFEVDIDIEVNNKIEEDVGYRANNIIDEDANNPSWLPPPHEPPPCKFNDVDSDVDSSVLLFDQEDIKYNDNVSYDVPLGNPISYNAFSNDPSRLQTLKINDSSGFLNSCSNNYTGVQKWGIY